MDAASTEQRSYAASKPLVILGLMSATALAALDGTIVATALPAIVGDLGGLPLYSLVVAVYLLASTTTVPLYGKLSDMYGRKPVFIFGAGLFVFGSMLCGLAWNMPSLIAFRGVQGLGAGAVLPIAITIIGDLFEVEERARLQGLFSGVWGVAGVVGPLIGGAIVELFHWSWVFFINVPIGVAAVSLIYLYLREPRIHTRQRVDVAGAVTLMLGVALLLWGLQSGGRGGWLDPVTLGCLAGAMALLVTFVLVERRAAAPILSLSLLARPMIAISSSSGVLAGGVLIGIVVYVPLLVQGAWGSRPYEAGLIIAPLSLGWPIASSQVGRLLRNFSYRALAFGGSVIVFMGTLLLLLILVPAVAASPLLRGMTLGLASFVAGAGFGISFTSMLIAVQNSVLWEERGIATGAVLFFRNMGNAIGAVVLGAILTATLAPALASQSMQALVRRLPSVSEQAGSDPTLGPVNVLFDLSLQDAIPPDVRAALASALSGSLGWVYFVVMLMAAGSALLASRFPRTIDDARENSDF